jgi:hypothetical protein
MSIEHSTLRQKIAADKAERTHRYAKFAAAWRAAEAAGKAAGDAVVPRPMLVRDELTGKVYEPVMDGVCGFAWVVAYPATSSFARWAAKEHGARREYGGGCCIRWIGEYSQSMERKQAFAHAFAESLRNALGLRIHSASRMD